MLIAIVGPSGAGKDTLLDLARPTLANDPRFHIARRCITRPATAGGEAHTPLTDAEFTQRLAAGDFALHWSAHTLRYAIPHTEISPTRTTIANLSRAILAHAARLFPLHILHITASPETLATRLAKRGRETPTDIAARLAREAPLPTNIPTTTILNDTSPEAAAAALLQALTRLTPPTAAAPRSETAHPRSPV